MPRRLFIGAAFVVLTSACHRTPVKLASAIPPAEGKLRTQYVMRFVDVAPGTGKEVQAEKCLYAHYTGWLTNGSKFDSSRDTTPQGEPRTPIAFKQGARQVIPGWDAGFEGMRVGGKRRLIIPYQLAYGANGRPPAIPGRSTLVFDVEVMDVTDAPPGSGPQAPRCPAWGDRVRTSR